MRRLVEAAIAVSAMCVVLFATQPDKSAPGKGGQAVLRADHALVQAIARADKPAAEPLLDDHFAWTDRTGKTRTKAQLLDDLSALAREVDSDTDLSVHTYGRVAIVTGVHRISAQNANVRFLRVWVEQKAGWRAFLHQGTTIAAPPTSAQQASSGSGVASATDCENPCRFAPFEPKTAAARQVIAAWQAVENAVKDPDPDSWTKYIGDEFEFVPKEDGRPVNKAERIATLKQQKQTGTRTPIGEAQVMHVWVFGNTAVQVGNQLTPTGAIPYHCTRVWVKRGGRWQMVYSQQTTVKQLNALS
jgi:hypothetical protein